MKIIDVNAAFGFWPIQRIPEQSLAILDRRYESLGIKEVWLSAVESILYPEPDTFDAALFAQLFAFPRFRAVKTVNPLLGNWEKSLRSSHARHSLAAIKLFPSYHDYSLEHPEVTRAAHVATSLGLPVLVQMRVNDERNQPTTLQVSGVKADTVAAFSQKVDQSVVIALSAYLGEMRDLEKGSPRLFADIAFLDGADPVGWASTYFASKRFVFGSLAPWLYPDAAVMKLQHQSIAHATRCGIASGHLLASLEGGAVA